MTSRPALETEILAALHAHISLAELMAKLARAQRHGDLDRMAAAAYDALISADALSARLSCAFGQAADLSARAYEPHSSDVRL